MGGAGPRRRNSCACPATGACTGSIGSAASSCPPSPSPSPAPPAPAASAQPVDMGERLAQLAQLGELMKAGLLTETEFEQQKARILNG